MTKITTNSFILSITVFFFSCSSSNLIIHSNNCSYVEIISVMEDSTDFCFSFYNKSNDTVYIFNNYMQPALCTSKYIHLYNNDETYTLSFLPYVQTFNVDYPCTIILGDKKIITKGQCVPEFTYLIPNKRTTIKIPKEAIFANQYIHNINLETSSGPLVVNKFDTLYVNSFDSLKIQFAAYLNIDLLSKNKRPSQYYLKDFYDAARKYDIVNYTYKKTNI